jgi:hypothetical protein
MADQACNDSIQLPASAIYSPATGWFYVIVAESESTGPRQPVSNWIPRSGLVSYGVVLALLAAVINALLCLVSLRRRSHGDKSTASGYDETDGGTTSWRRLALINFTVVQLAVGVVIVPVKVMTDTLGMWTIGGAACRIYLLGQVRAVLQLSRCTSFLQRQALQMSRLRTSNIAISHQTAC